MKKDLLKMLDMSAEDIEQVLNLADQMKYNQKKGIPHRALEGKSLAMIFSKASTRTRVSFEVGMHQLGGTALFLSANDLQLGRGEPVCDTAAVLSRYVDGIMIRTYHQSDVEELAAHASVPVINGLTDFAHPCQVLADLMTIRERFHTLEGLKLAYVGDGNNMANSLIVGCLKVKMTVACASPKGYEPDARVLDFANANGGFTLTNDPAEAVADADVVVTDVWASMGQEAEHAQRVQAFAGYQLTLPLLSAAKPTAIVLHCLPAHRGEEIAADVLDKYSDVIFEEAENRLHAQKAVMALLMG